MYFSKASILTNLMLNNGFADNSNGATLCLTCRSLRVRITVDLPIFLNIGLLLLCRPGSTSTQTTKIPHVTCIRGIKGGVLMLVRVNEFLECPHPIINLS